MSRDLEEREAVKLTLPPDDFFADGILPLLVFYASERGSVLAPFWATGGPELVVLSCFLQTGVNQYRCPEN